MASLTFRIEQLMNLPIGTELAMGTTEIILIIVLALVIFGGSRLSGVGKALGQSIREFKSEVKDSDEKKADDDKKEETKA